ncbi:MAG: hypothetical protein KAS38_04175, partial [Anaerolineales bacterium]|nr:hypothetical protein [Anaerolineales bacterium]
QKLIEESPCPILDSETREKLCKSALKVVKQTDYVGAATVEFLLDKDMNFYFIEVNTRIQVEHPVTEMVTGQDLIKWQLKVASGEPINLRQKDIRLNGAAIECRINAEDPYNNFLPSTGVISHSLLPTGPGVRVDTGIYPGIEISPYYDSLISKLIVWGETRAEAVLRMRRSLEEYKIVGVRTIIPFHQSLMDSLRFMTGQFDTRFIEERFSIEAAEEGKVTYPDIAAIMATLVAHQQTQRAAHIIQRGDRDTSNWKWISRWERLRR